ncbi:MAG: DUF1385 domain-containing protein [Candidatus Aenigmatarchaeota archaeon]|nr:MAG: DUF1385 domain-containing protein [Candidatus Aenigmarchaeota archaeon]
MKKTTDKTKRSRHPDIIGGQAVINGVMMKNKDKVAVAVRKDTGEIELRRIKFKSLMHKKLFQLPFLRGIIILFEMLILGIKALNISSELSISSEEEKTNLLGFIIVFLFSLVFAVLLFVFLPLWTGNLLYKKTDILFNIIDGIIRIGVFVAYIFIISLLKDVKVLFRYHGAEHKTIHCYEHREKLTPKNIKKYSTLHSRCGTTFIFIVMVVSILFFSLITSKSFFIKLLTRLLFVPVIAGVSYELLRLGFRYENNFFVEMMIFPGLMFQKITTKEPDEKQIEVAIKAFNAVK